MDELSRWLAALAAHRGLPLVVVVWGADALAACGSDLGESRLDHAQQALRSVCLAAGAALVYAAASLPDAVANLRSYVMHLLFTPDASSSLDRIVRPQVVDRESVFVPAGWDSWGKIRALRGDFPCETYAALFPVPPSGLPDDGDAHHYDSSDVDDDDDANQPPGGPVANALALFAREIPDKSPRPTQPDPLVEPEDEQAFLEKHAKFLQSLDSSIDAPSPSSNNFVGSTAPVARAATISITNGAHRRNDSNTGPARQTSVYLPNGLAKITVSPDESESNLNADARSNILDADIVTSPTSTTAPSALPSTNAPRHVNISPKRRAQSVRDAKSQIASSKDALQEMRSKIISQREQTAALREKSRSTIALSESTTKRMVDRSESFNLSMTSGLANHSTLGITGASGSLAGMMGGSSHGGTATTAAANATAAAAAAAAAATGAADSNQNEVLATFFQSLLSKKKLPSSTNASLSAVSGSPRTVSPALQRQSRGSPLATSRDTAKSGTTPASRSPLIPSAKPDRRDSTANPKPT